MDFSDFMYRPNAIRRHVSPPTNPEQAEETKAPSADVLVVGTAEEAARSKKAWGSRCAATQPNKEGGPETFSAQSIDGPATEAEKGKIKARCRSRRPPRRKSKEPEPPAKEESAGKPEEQQMQPQPQQKKKKKTKKAKKPLHPKKKADAVPKFYDVPQSTEADPADNDPEEGKNAPEDQQKEAQLQQQNIDAQERDRKRVVLMRQKIVEAEIEIARLELMKNGFVEQLRATEKRSDDRDFVRPYDIASSSQPHPDTVIDPLWEYAQDPRIAIMPTLEEWANRPRGAAVKDFPGPVASRMDLQSPYRRRSLVDGSGKKKE